MSVFKAEFGDPQWPLWASEYPLPLQRCRRTCRRTLFCPSAGAIEVYQAPPRKQGRVKELAMKYAAAIVLFSTAIAAGCASDPPPPPGRSDRHRCSNAARAARAQGVGKTG